jgi:hypothetical protein
MRPHADRGPTSRDAGTQKETWVGGETKVEIKEGPWSSGPSSAVLGWPKGEAKVEVDVELKEDPSRADVLQTHQMTHLPISSIAAF